MPLSASSSGMALFPRHVSKRPRFESTTVFTPNKRDIRMDVSFIWWGKVDSNHRRHCQQIYSLSPLATREIPQIYGYSIGAGGRIRTPDLLITNQLLYQLSYTSISPANRIIPELSLNVNKKVYQETENLSL